MRLLAAALALFAAQVLLAAEPISRTITVPLDYTNTALGHAELTIEFGAPFDRTKPTVIVVADGQQFYLQRGSVAELQTRRFGDAFNVVGILGRGATDAFIAATRGEGGATDWRKAWQIFRAEQWMGDIDAVRRALAGDDGNFYLFGASGGADLIHQFLLRYGRHVLRAYTGSPGNDALARELRLRDEGTWDELSSDPSLEVKLQKVLADHPAERAAIMTALQRQHFFVSAADLPRERSALIDALARWDVAAFAHARETYQVDAILELERSPRGIAIAVREFEFLYASGTYRRLGDGHLHPSIEAVYTSTKPLIELAERGDITPPRFDLTPAHALSTEVFLLAARWDEAIDYRISIALAYSYPHHELFLADDNHMFGNAKAGELQSRIVQTFLRYGLGSPELRKLLDEIEWYRWHE
ncbi:MAG: hypothetical protein JO197_16840 [Acidobacteria bacterium]|nr:hypothetical protein [Acidobacteriota bacterium]MBV9478510.1 hypothetical protein [Acidobacteriota bacterium]